MISKMFLALILIIPIAVNCNQRSPLETKVGEFTLLMRSGEVVYRYSFYNEFWKNIAKHFGKHMNPGFHLNSTIINPNNKIQQDEQEISAYGVSGDYLPAFYEDSMAKICCFNGIVPIHESQCKSGNPSFDSLFSKIMASKSSEKIVNVRKRFNFTFTFNDTINVSQEGPYYLALVSCSEKQWVQVYPKAIGVNEYGYLSAEAFPLLPLYGIAALIYLLIGVIWVITVYLNKSYAIPLHYILALMILVNCANFFAAFYESYKTNLGYERTSLKYVSISLDSAMCSLNAFVLLMLSVGYGVSYEYKKQYIKIGALCMVYFLFLTMRCVFDRNKESSLDDKYPVLVKLFAIAIAAIAGYGYCSSCRVFSDLRQQFNFDLISRYGTMLIGTMILGASQFVFSYKLTDYQFRDKYYYLAWLDSGNWYILQLLDTIIVLYFYSPKSLKSSLISHAEVRTQREGNMSAVQELEDAGPENKNETAEEEQHETRKSARRARPEFTID